MRMGLLSQVRQLFIPQNCARVVRLLAYAGTCERRCPQWLSGAYHCESCAREGSVTGLAQRPVLPGEQNVI